MALVLGQDLDRECAEIAAATLFIQGVDVDIHVANSLITDNFEDEHVDFAVCQPPFGMSWKNNEWRVKERVRIDGWYGFGLPATNDSTWLFASQIIKKLKTPEEGGGRAVVFAAPGALHGGSRDGIRRNILENDLLEAIIGLPSGLTPNTNIPLYALVFSSKKSLNRQGKVQTIDLRSYFETSSDRETSARVLRKDAYNVLLGSLGSVKDGFASRTLPTEYFLRRKVQMGIGQMSASDASGKMAWKVEVPTSVSQEKFLSERYGHVRMDASSTGDVVCRLEIDSVFDTTFQRILRQMKSQNWITTRLSALLSAPLCVLNQADTQEPPPDIYLPLGSSAATVDPVLTSKETRVLAVRLDCQKVSPGFLAAWLNSSLGQDSRRRAIDRAASGSIFAALRTEPRALLTFADELLIPLPSLMVQEEMAAADARLSAVSSMVDRAGRDLWDRPEDPRRTVARFEGLFDDSLGKWATDLPYPIASALWTFESKRLNLDAAHKQIFLVWESYSAFMGTVLLSALAQDPVLRESQIPVLRETLQAARLTMQRATLGGWNIIVQRLAACFRELLASPDPDERSRVLQIFGSPTYGSLNGLLSPAVVRLLSDANGKRNLWAGHAGAMSEEEMQGHLAYLVGRLEELREEVGSAWSELRLVRAGGGSLVRGQIQQNVELAMGSNTPFRQGQLRVGALMESGELYLAANGAAQPLRLEHLMVMRRSQGNVRDSCYFYNRLEGRDIRLVSYHQSERSDVTERLDDVLLAVQDLVSP